MSYIGSLPSLIPGSESLSSLYSQNTKITKLMSNDITLENNTISGVSDPINGNDAATKQYVNNTFGIYKSEKIITNNSNITYDAVDIYNGFIQRYLESSDRTDKFPTAAEIVSIVTATNTLINKFDCIIQNMSTIEENNVLTIDLYQSGITVISPLETSVVVNPYSNVYFKILVTNFTTGSETVEVYYNKTFFQDFSNNIYLNQSGYNLNIPIRTTNVFSQKTIPKTISTVGLYQASDIINTIITRVSSSGVDIFPTSASILSTLGLTSINESWGFETVIRNQTGSPLQISSNTGITFDFSEPFILGIENSITFFTRYNGSGFTVLILKITSFDSLCVIS